jgi:imidazolonepropionase-like amidohydrolase
VKLLFAAFALTCSAQSLVIENVTVIDATGAAPQSGMFVGIDQGQITRISKPFKAPKQALVIDGTGKFLIPGLWDMHVHIGAPEVFFPLLLANGVTGIREMFTGIPIQTIREWRLRSGVPRIIAAGFLDGPMMLNNGQPPQGAFAIANPEQARVGVRALAQSGADFLKVYNSIPRDAYFALAEEARTAGIPFAGHVPEAVSTGEASDAGQRSEEHLINVMLDCSTNAEKLRADRIAAMTSDKITGEARLRTLAWPDPEGLFNTYDEEKASALFAKFVKNGTWHTPTLAVLSGFARARDDDFVRDSRRRFLPAQWTSAWDPRVTFFLRDLSPEDYFVLHARLVVLLVRYQRLVGDMRKAGVEFLAGTDANGWNPVLPGFGLHEELALLVQSGLTPMEALQSATRNPARYLNKLDEFGTVEVKKAADLVLLNANPLDDIRNTQKIEAVIERGRYYSRKDLDAMLRTMQ